MKIAKMWYWPKGSEKSPYPIEIKLKLVKFSPIILESSDKKIRIEFSNLPLREVYLAKYCRDNRVADRVKLQVGKKVHQTYAMISVIEPIREKRYHLHLEGHYSMPEYKIEIDFEEKDMVEMLKQEKKLIEKNRLEIIKSSYRNLFMREFDKFFEEIVKEVKGEGQWYSD